MFYRMNLQLFEDGAGAGSAGQGGNAGTGNGIRPNNGGTGNQASYSFEQAEEIANARAQRAEQSALKSYFQQQGMTEGEVKAALADYRANKEKQKPNVSAIEQERDEALSKLQRYENEKILSGMNVKPEDLDYVSYKVNKLVTDKKDFKAAATEFLKSNPRYAGQGTYRVSTGTQSGAGSVQTPNEQINDVIRNAFRRK